eukprot:GHVU01211447.1.p1 GENE.GHVU01211447.1~~GHVU01211447.1.p1  ORF type:complete len:359 (+),score=67.87 GHVU01211447.1:225-1301(+)
MPPRGRNFQPEEDDALAKAWLAVSTDASTNTDQTTEDFYGRIKEAFDAKMAAKPVAERTWQSLKSRFQTISHDCAKYSACVSRIQRLNESGGSNLDAYLSALSLYERDATSEGAKGAAAKFNFQSAFQTLKDSPKWQTHIDSEAKDRQAKDNSKKRSAPASVTSTGDAPAGEGDEDEDSGPPAARGVKACKTAQAQLKLYTRQVAAAEAIAALGQQRNQTYMTQVDTEYQQLCLQQDAHALHIMSLPVPAEEGPSRNLILTMQQAELDKYSLREQQRRERASLFASTAADSTAPMFAGTSSNAGVGGLTASAAELSAPMYVAGDPDSASAAESGAPAYVGASAAMEDTELQQASHLAF